MGRLRIDDQFGTRWAVAIARSIGAAVYRHLALDLVNLNLPRAKVEPWAHGAADPVAPNRIGGRDNPAGRAENRRVELWLLKQ